MLYMYSSFFLKAVRFTRQFPLPASATSSRIIRATIVASANDIHIRISDNGTSHHLLSAAEISTDLHIGGGLAVQNPKDLYSFSHIRNAARLGDERLGALRKASSRASVIYGTVAEQLAPLFPIKKQQGDEVTLAEPPASAAVPGGRIGLGLPMSNIYATYFGTARLIMKGEVHMWP